MRDVLYFVAPIVLWGAFGLVIALDIRRMMRRKEHKDLMEDTWWEEHWK